MVLEKTVVFETHSTNSPEDRTLHKAVGVGAESINYVVVIPDIDLWYCGIRTSKWFCAEPPHIIIKVVLVTLGPQLLVKWIIPPLFRIADGCPLLEGTVNSNSVVVDLVAATNHDVERTLRMRP